MPEANTSGIFRYALGVEYRGTRYNGWQRQEHREDITSLEQLQHAQQHVSIQSWIEMALSKVADESITAICAGRTDRGVHAREQVIHFDTRAHRPLKAWVLGTNAHLPDDISITWTAQVDETFHARFSATARTYRYVITNRDSRPALGRDLMTWERRPLDFELMHEAAQCLLGEHDFSSFRGNSCQSKTPFRNIHHIHVRGVAGVVVIEIKANAFLHHMVRNIVGVLMQVGVGDRPRHWVHEVLDAKNRTAAGITAHANGLYLMHIDYPVSFGLPQLSLSSLQAGAVLEGLLGGDFC